MQEARAKPQDRIRVVFEGGFCEQPPLDLIRMLGRTCYVVDDDFLIGLRWILEDVPTGTTRWRATWPRRYLERSSYSPVQHDTASPRRDAPAAGRQAPRADAVIVAAAKMCEPGLEEQVAYTHALDEKGDPYFVSEFEENMISFEHLETAGRDVPGEPAVRLRRQDETAWKTKSTR